MMDSKNDELIVLKMIDEGSLGYCFEADKILFLTNDITEFIINRLKFHSAFIDKKKNNGMYYIKLL